MPHRFSFGAKTMADRIDPAAMKIPAPFINQFQIIQIGNNIRIAFAEGFQGEPSNYRSAVTMSANDALLLASSILNSLPQPSPFAPGLGAASGTNAFGVPISGDNALASLAALTAANRRYDPKKP
jgi:hypothetical protein